jgi:glyoxylase-like metal-dependent hydrolase (beta-lactamase superfamily II)
LKKISKKKKILLSLAALVLIAAVIALIIFYPMLLMRPAGTGAIPDTGIIAVKNGMNAVYLIESGSGYVMIDAGSDAEALVKTLYKIGIKRSEVTHILLTHSDYDHVAALDLFPDADIYMSEDEEQMINGETKRNAGGSNSLPGGIAPDSLVYLKDKQIITFGELTIKCLSAPGHTPGSMSFIIDDRYLFTGDAFMISDNKLSVHPFTMDKDTAADTIQKFYAVIKETDLTLTAHYGYYNSHDL